jgi:CBS domain-containing protein
MSHLSTPVAAYARGPLITVRTSTPLDAVLELLERQEISAVPVLDEEGRAAGVLSRTDLLRVGAVPPGDARARLGMVELPAKLAGEVMHRGVFTVDRTTPVATAAKKMVDRRVHRVFVTDDDGVVVEIFGTREVLGALRESRDTVPLGAVMTRKPFTIPLDAPITLATSRLAAAHVHGLVVVDPDGWPVGLFTQREALLARALDPCAAVEEAMSYGLLCLNIRTPLHRAAAHAAATRARRVLVTDARETVGVISTLDFARIAYSRSIRRELLAAASP